jgi:preprotein translocase SecE subunit
MARNRQRRRPGNPGPAPSEPHRENVPGELEHASGEVDEFDAALVAGANGQADPDVDDAELEAEATAALGDLDDDGDIDEDDRAMAAPTRAPARRAAAGDPTKGRGGPRFIQFLGACWAELQRVQWPDRRQVFQATGVVIGFVIVAGAYLGLADWVAKQIVDAIL